MKMVVGGQRDRVSEAAASMAAAARRSKGMGEELEGDAGSPTRRRNPWPLSVCVLRTAVPGGRRSKGRGEESEGPLAWRAMPGKIIESPTLLAGVAIGHGWWSRVCSTVRKGMARRGKGRKERRTGDLRKTRKRVTCHNLGMKVIFKRKILFLPIFLCHSIL